LKKKHSLKKEDMDEEELNDVVKEIKFEFDPEVVIDVH